MYIQSDVTTGALAGERLEAIKNHSLNSHSQNVQVKFGGEDENVTETQAFLGQSFMSLWF